MSDFWDKLNTPIPFYTIENVNATIKYIAISNVEYRELFISALKWVLSVLEHKKINYKYADKHIISNAYGQARELHDIAVNQKDLVAAVRWRYTMSAIRDYARSLYYEKQ